MSHHIIILIKEIFRSIIVLVDMMVNQVEFQYELYNVSATKGRRSHRYLPQGVLKVVRKLLSLLKGTCQYPDFESSKLKYFESASSGRMSSTVLLYH